ncbi:hypothetical protein DM992_38010 [Burkholderia sp. JP2-270]|nr:hypothetical protein DM992_38010 [Burkholderia sp. JP2-270]
MKQRISHFMKLPVFLFAGFCLCFARIDIATAASDAMAASKERSSTVVAVVNHVAITEADVDRTVAHAGAPDSVALRQMLKYQLISLELLRQAADRLHYADQLEAGGQKATECRTIGAIRLYLRDMVRPAPVSDEEVEVRYRTLVSNTHALNWANVNLDARACATLAGARDPVATISPGMPISHFASDVGACSSGISVLVRGAGVVALRKCIRQQLEAERLDEAVRTLVDKLMSGAEIELR